MSADGSSRARSSSTPLMPGCASLPPPSPRQRFAASPTLTGDTQHSPTALEEETHSELEQSGDDQGSCEASSGESDDENSCLFFLHDSTYHLNKLVARFYSYDTRRKM